MTQRPENVEEKIKKHYCAEGGDWLVEKGKVKEARLLKEAYHRILSLKGDVRMYLDWYQREKSQRIEFERSLEGREKRLKEQERRFNEQRGRLKKLLED